MTCLTPRLEPPLRSTGPEPLLVTGHPIDPDRSETDYEARLRSADTKYARALTHLKAGLEQRAKALRQLP
jgi:hypothetical protein